MQREQFHELLTHAAEVCARRELVIFGSQSVHALTASPPAEVLVSVECDIWLQDEPEVAARLAAELGKGSAFARTTCVRRPTAARPADVAGWVGATFGISFSG